MAGGKLFHEPPVKRINHQFVGQMTDDVIDDGCFFTDDLKPLVENNGTIVSHDIDDVNDARVSFTDSPSHIANKLNDNTESKSEISQRKKRKLIELKKTVAIKKDRSNFSAEYELISTGGVTLPQIQLNLLLQYSVPGDDRLSALTAAHFLTIPPLVESNKKDSMRDPFVRAIAAGVKSYKKALKRISDDSACPLVVIICSNANHATEIVKSISTCLKCRVAKLFSRHFKVRRIT